MKKMVAGAWIGALPDLSLDPLHDGVRQGNRHCCHARLLAADRATKGKKLQAVRAHTSVPVAGILHNT